MGLIFGGAFICYLGLGAVFGLGLYQDWLGVVPGIFGLLGLFIACVGLGALVWRGRLAIIIDAAGIRLHIGNVFAVGSAPPLCPRENSMRSFGVAPRRLGE